MKTDTHIATSGWHYAHWRHLFYPDHLSAGEYLRHYTHQFTATEINTTFYQLPTPPTVHGWMKAVPSSFIFCPKMHRSITHEWKLAAPERTLPPFFASIAPLKGQMGPILVQLPPSLDFDKTIAGKFFQLLRHRYGDHDFALEIRHVSWLQEEAVQLLKDHTISLVMADSGNKWPSAELLTGRHIYLRFHGPDGSYSTSYPDSHLLKLARKIEHWRSTGHQVWAFFNNDGHGHAVRNAQFLRTAADGSTPSGKDAMQLHLF